MRLFKTQISLIFCFLNTQTKLVHYLKKIKPVHYFFKKISNRFTIKKNMYQTGSLLKIKSKRFTILKKLKPVQYKNKNLDRFIAFTLKSKLKYS